MSGGSERFSISSSSVDNTKIGIYGRSKGAELVLAGQSILDDVQCLVLNSPSNVIFEGIKGKLNSNSSSWTYLQKELPYQKFQLGDYLLNKFLENIFLKIVGLRLM